MSDNANLLDINVSSRAGRFLRGYVEISAVGGWYCGITRHQVAVRNDRITLPNWPACVMPGGPQTVGIMAFRSGAALMGLDLRVSDLAHGVLVKLLANRLAQSAAGVESDGFRAFRDLVEDVNFWVNVGCPEQLSRDGPPYKDVAPLAWTLVESAEDGVLWGTDWPHPKMKS